MLVTKSNRAELIGRRQALRHVTGIVRATGKPGDAYKEALREIERLDELAVVRWDWRHALTRHQLINHALHGVLGALPIVLGTKAWLAPPLGLPPWGVWLLALLIVWGTAVGKELIMEAWRHLEVRHLADSVLDVAGWMAFAVAWLAVFARTP